MGFADILGILAAIGTTGSFVPQALKVYKTKKTEDLSLGMYVLFCGGVVLWLLYGFMIKAYPVLLANGTTLIMASYILIMKLKHR